ncbi:ABC transporter substrate-binding protein [Novosphingobium sp. ZW T3_23]|uniref:ABC transporter substrate-binding protein n=1 Tax=Novosphingobium sp. ZW T3_23 TaxID=3378084 RepID=UPI003853A8F8
MIKGRAVLALLLPLFAFVGACSPKGGEAEEKIVDIAGIVSPKDGKNEFIGGLARIQEDGWLDAELAKKGWKARWVPVPASVGGPVVNEGFAAKTIDLAAYGDLPSVIAMAGGVDLRLVVPSRASTNIYLAVGRDSTARTLRDLKGKRIALHRGRPWEAGFARYVQSQGMTLDDFKIINVNAVAGQAALTSGKVDGIVLIQAEAYVLQDKGLARILWSTSNAPESWKMTAGTFARKDFLDAHPDIVQTVVTAFVRQAQWSSDEKNRDTVLSWGTLGGTPLAAVIKDTDNNPLPWRQRYSPLPGPAIQEHFDFVADYASRTGLTRSKVDVSNLIDRRYVDQAIKDLKLEGWWSDPTAR